MIYIGKTVFAAVIAAAVLTLAAMAGVMPAEAAPTATPTATVPPPTPTATPVPATATPTATAVAPTPTPTATAAASPHIYYDPALMSFTATAGSAAQPEKVLLIRNAGSGNLRWTVSATFPWIGLFPDTGTCSAGEVDTVAVWVDPEGLSVGTHTGQIMISSVDADNSPQWVYLSLTVSEQAVSPTATPRATPSATPSATMSASPTPSPTPSPAEGGGGLPTWVWPVVGVLAVLVLALGVLLLHPARLWGRLRGLFPHGGEEAAEGLTTEETYEDVYGDEGGEPPEEDV
jgi:hypothetical protein